MSAFATPVQPSAARPLDGAEAGRLARRAAYAASGVALFLLTIKAVGGYVTGSVGLLGSLIDSALDLAASLLNVLALREASLPADREHRFGHGKAEALAGLGQAALIAGSSAYLILESARRLVSPVAPSHSVIGILIILASMSATMLLVLYQRSVVRRTGSLAICADSLHYRSDLVLNASVILGLVLSGMMNLPRADAVAGLLVGLYIAHGAWRIARLAYDQLMDREFDEADRAEIKAIIDRNPQVRHMHDLRTRRSGFDRFIQLHIELDPQISLLTAHAISDRVEAEIKAAFPHAEVIIHEDPAGIEDLSRLIEQ
jgi:ferrous-iron efflux pump FieF